MSIFWIQAPDAGQCSHSSSTVDGGNLVPLRSTTYRNQLGWRVCQVITGVEDIVGNNLGSGLLGAARFLPSTVARPKPLARHMLGLSLSALGARCSALTKSMPDSATAQFPESRAKYCDHLQPYLKWLSI